MPQDTKRTPDRKGFYWAKWRIAADGTADNGEGCGGTNAEWEVVGVFENTNDVAAPEHLMVEVPGVAKGQPIENFFWGPGPLDLARAYYTPATELNFRYEVRAALGWNDKTSLDILGDGVRRLKADRDDLLSTCRYALALRHSPMGTAYELPRVLSAIETALAKSESR